MPRRKIQRMTEARLRKHHPPGDREYEVPDPALDGVVYRIYPSGKVSVAVRYRTPDGHKKRHAIGVIGKRQLTISRAQTMAEEKLTAVKALEADPSAERKKRRAEGKTVAQVMAAYLEHCRKRLKPKTIKGYEGCENTCEPLASKRAADLDVPTVRRWHDSLSDTPYQANRALALLSASLNHANVGTDKVNPCKWVKPFAEKNRERFLDDDEKARLRTAIGEGLKQGRLSRGALGVIRMVMETGCRPDEAVTLTWGMVATDRPALYLPDSKTGRKVIFLSDAAARVVAERRRGKPGELVFQNNAGNPIEVGNLQRTWRALRDRAGLDKVRLYDLRHTYASDAIVAGVPLEVVGKVIGNEYATKRYVHIADKIHESAVKQIAAHRKKRKGK